MPKGFKNEGKIDTQTHQKSMRKLVTKKIRKLIKNHVSLNGRMVKSLKFIVKTSVLDGSEGCMYERQRYQKNIKNDTQIHPKIDEQSIQNSCLKKGYPKDGKSCPK